MKTSQRGIDLIKQFEGLRLKAYRCIAGVPTIGYGSTDGVTAEDVANGRTITKQQAEAMLKRDLIAYENAVLRACTITPNQNQFDAMVCLAYNIGTGGFMKSSIVKAHNRGDFMSASRAFLMWGKARVKGVLQEVPGLMRRRAAESSLYLTPVATINALADLPDEVFEEMPQAVAPERPMSQSKIAGAASIISGASAIGGLSQVTDVLNTVSAAGDSVAQVKDQAAGLGNLLIPALLIAVACLGGYIVYERWKQRQEGRA